MSRKIFAILTKLALRSLLREKIFFIFSEKDLRSLKLSASLSPMLRKSRKQKTTQNTEKTMNTQNTEKTQNTQNDENTQNNTETQNIQIMTNETIKEIALNKGFEFNTLSQPRALIIIGNLIMEAIGCSREEAKTIALLLGELSCINYSAFRQKLNRICFDKTASAKKQSLAETLADEF